MNFLNGINKSSKFLDRYKEYSYTLLRIVTGYLFMWHGTQKILDFRAGKSNFSDIKWW